MIPITRLKLPKPEDMYDDFRKIISSGRLTMGPYLKEFEEKLSKYADVKHVVTTNSCTQGITIALRASGIIGRVLTTPFTYIATASAIKAANLDIVFADIDRETFNLDPDAVRKAQKNDITISAIVPVHVFGNPADIQGMWGVAGDFGASVIWDSAHACGSEYHMRKVGGFEMCDVFSFAPTKSCCTFEGGAILTEHDDIAEKARSLTRLGLPQNIDFQSDDRHFTEIGYNSRMSEIHALLGIKTLEMLDDSVSSREKSVALYRKELVDTGLVFQKQEPHTVSANFAFPVIVDKEKIGITREELQTELKKKEIETRHIWFFPCIHKQPAYSGYASLSFPNAEYVSNNILCLPLWSEMKNEEVIEVCNAIKRIVSLRRYV